MGRNLKTEFLDERAADLDRFVQDLFAPERINELAVHEVTAEFLGLSAENKHVLSTITSAASVDGDGGTGVRSGVRGKPGVGIYDEAVVAALKRAKKLIDDAYNAKDGDGWKLHSSAGGTDCFLKKEGEFTYTKVNKRLSS
jgi:hypothetical protein